MKVFIVVGIAATVAAIVSIFGVIQTVVETTKVAQLAERLFKINKKFIDDHNAKFATGEVTFLLGVNQFTNRNFTEVIAQLCRSVPLREMRALAYTTNPATQFPAAEARKNWTSIMQPIRDQKSCGSCWAFAAVAQLESLYKRTYSNYPNYVMSPQYLVDCSRATPNKGCNGGNSAVAMGKFFKLRVRLFA